MLRITRMVGNDSIETLKLEGKLEGPWVREAHDAYGAISRGVRNVPREADAFCWARALIRPANPPPGKSGRRAA